MSVAVYVVGGTVTVTVALRFFVVLVRVVCIAARKVTLKTEKPVKRMKNNEITDISVGLKILLQHNIAMMLKCT